MVNFISPASVQQKRLEICKGCKWAKNTIGVLTCGTPIVGNSVDDEKINIVGHKRKKIKLCGCVMKAKVKLSFAECPAGKWSYFKYDRVKYEVDYGTKQMFIEFMDMLDAVKGRYEHEMIVKIISWASRLSGQLVEHTTCGPCVRAIIKELRAVRDEFKNQEIE